MCAQTCNTVYTDESGRYKVVLPAEKVNVKVHLKDENRIFEVVERNPVSDPAYIELKDMEFKKTTNFGDILFSAYVPYVKLNNQQVINTDSNVHLPQNLLIFAGLVLLIRILEMSLGIGFL